MTAVSIPIIAGMVSDGEELLLDLCLVRKLCRVGTRFVVAKESMLIKPTKAKILKTRDN